MMRNRSSMIAYAIFGLAAVGIIANLFDRPATMLIPLLVLGIIFYLYKFPPRRGRRRYNGMRTERQASARKTSKKAKFRVIRGNKRDDDEPPRYH